MVGLKFIDRDVIDEADEMAEETSTRYTHEEVFDKIWKMDTRPSVRRFQCQELQLGKKKQ